LQFAAHAFWVSPVIPWVLVVATVAISIWMHRRLEQAVVEASGTGEGIEPTGFNPLESEPTGSATLVQQI